MIYSKLIFSLFHRGEVHLCQQKTAQQKWNGKKGDAQFRFPAAGSDDTDKERSDDGGEFSEKIVESEKLSRICRGNDPAEKGTAQRLDPPLRGPDQDRKSDENRKPEGMQCRYGKQKCQHRDEKIDTNGCQNQITGREH